MKEKTLKEKVEFIINKFGYKTSYAENILYAIEQSEINSDYEIWDNFLVIFKHREVESRFVSNNKFLEYRTLRWNLTTLLGEYILNDNPEYFDENN